jgi:hypothetical protein
MSGTRFIRSRSALIALGLATTTACVDGAPTGDGPDDRPSTTTAGMFECGQFGRVALREGKVVQDDMVLGYEDELPELCEASVQDELFSIGYNTNNRKWPGGQIPFRIRSTVPYSIEQRIEAAIDHWEDETAIDFVAYNENVHDDWVEFSTDTWCHADVGRRGGRQNVWLTDDKTVTEVRGVAISGEDWVYTWYADYSVSAGTSTSADAHRAVYKFSTPPGYVPNQIVEIAIAADDRVYTWWNDGKVSIGTSSDLDAHSPPQGNFQVAAGKTRSMIVGIGIGPGDTVYTWYNDGTRSVGNSQNLATSTGTYNWPKPDTSIFGMDFNSGGSVYTWY